MDGFILFFKEKENLAYSCCISKVLFIHSQVKLSFGIPA